MPIFQKSQNFKIFSGISAKIQGFFRNGFKLINLEDVWSNLTSELQRSLFSSDKYLEVNYEVFNSMAPMIHFIAFLTNAFITT